MTILIENLQDKVAISETLEELIKRTVDYCLQFEKFDVPSEISILLVDNKRIRSLNKEFRNIDLATDVLSFPMVDICEGKIQSDEGDFDLDEELLVLGDVVVSVEMAESQANEYLHSFEREITFLITHGIYHLLGYDHVDKSSETIMIGKQEKVLMELGQIK